jgi:hypothetical protein
MPGECDRAVPERFIVAGVTHVHRFTFGLSAEHSGAAIVASADRYKHYAAECIRVAQYMQDSADKAMLLDMAQMWRRLAEIAENMNQVDASYDKKTG